MYVLGLLRSSVPELDEEELNALCPSVFTLFAAFACEAASDDETERILEIDRMYSFEEIAEVLVTLRLRKTNCGATLAVTFAKRLLLLVNIFAIDYTKLLRKI